MAQIEDPALKPPELGALGLGPRIDGLPLVLAGPILRQVTDRSVSVWLALRHSAQLTLEIFDAAGAAVASVNTGPNTFELGTKLHVGLARAEFDADLIPGGLYQYNVRVTATGVPGPRFPGGSVTGDLFTAGVIADTSTAARAAVCYADFSRPTFVFPPASLATLRINHGSCRKPHAPSHDALAILDKILQENAKNPSKRSQQLLLTGDQIYADDVAHIISALTSDAAPVLLGRSEALPDLGGNSAPGPATRFGPETRRKILASQAFGSGATDQHLLSFGEYAAMYMFTYSDVLWPSRMPSYEEIFKWTSGTPLPREEVETDLEGPETHVRKYWVFARFEGQEVRVQNFKADLPKVRRALANIATYMTFDDHDVTDDWYMNRGTIRSLLEPEHALGRRIVFDGLLAYVFFQGWGNTPGKTAGNRDQTLDGRIQDVLTAYAAWRNSQFDDLFRSPLDDLLGLPLLLETIPEAGDKAGVQVRAFERGSTALNFDYTVRFPAHELVSLDVRTRRGYPRSEVQNAALIIDDELRRQTRDTNSAESRVTFVICPRPPADHPGISFIQEFVTSAASMYEFDVESWVLDRTASERLFSALAARGSRQRRVVLLCGDVHHGYAFRHQYKSDSPSADLGQTAAPASAVFATFISSAFKNQDFKTLLLHRLGFAAPFFRPFDKRLTRRLTWNRSVSADEVVGKVPVQIPDALGGEETVQLDVKAKPGRGVVVIDNLARAIYEVGAPDGATVQFNTPPDAVLETEFVVSRQDREGITDKLTVDDSSLGERLKDYAAYLVASVFGIYDRSIGPGQEIVGPNNLGLVRFETATNGDPIAVQELWWAARNSAGDLVTQPFSVFPITLTIQPPTV